MYLVDTGFEFLRVPFPPHILRWSRCCCCKCCGSRAAGGEAGCACCVAPPACLERAVPGAPACRRGVGATVCCPGPVAAAAGSDRPRTVYGASGLKEQVGGGRCICIAVSGRPGCACVALLGTFQCGTCRRSRGMQAPGRVPVKRHGNVPREQLFNGFGPVSQLQQPSCLLQIAPPAKANERVPAARAAELIATAAYHRLDEAWISGQPVLFMGENEWGWLGASLPSPARGACDLFAIVPVSWCA